MAQLSETTIDTLTTPVIKNAVGDTKINVDLMNITARCSRKSLVQVDSKTWGTSTTREDFTLFTTLDNIPDFKANSLISMYFHVPVRSYRLSWGGIYVEPQVRFNTGTWYSLGASGFDQMFQNSENITTYNNSIIFDPQQTSNFSVQFRFWMASYAESTIVNGSHSINYISNTVPFSTPNVNATQHYFHIVVEELALLKV